MMAGMVNGVKSVCQSSCPLLDGLHSSTQHIPAGRLCPMTSPLVSCVSLTVSKHS